MSKAVRAESVQHAGCIVTVAVLISIGLSYLMLGCMQDWVIIGGLLIDGLGALVIAAPDLECFRENSYAGRLQKAHDAEVVDPSEHHIPIRADWYPIFLQEMDDAFGGESVSSTSEFYIKRMNDNHVLYHQSTPKDDAKPMSVSVAGQQMRGTIDLENSQIRRTGAGLLIFGFATQFLGYIFDGTLGLGLIC